MFTGIVEEVGTINKITTQQSIVNLTIGCQTILSDMHIGDSISVNGACLTVVEFDSHSFSVQVIKGTENKTYLNQLKQSQEVNLERAMSGQGRFGGHFVLGHVDEVAKITRIKASDNSKIVTIKPNSTHLIKQMVQQGSITIDGVSLTIFKLKDSEFDIHLIPETRKSTILNDKRVGDPVHIETDMLFKYVERIIETTDSGLTSDKLKAFGF
ncbi:riboflavin synthase [Staphylococcus sp. ACRSN]|uniref:riboflavin synthase n=1 Tax=Staphylococcus sp. ACRSN TaxID=2918214 RepID=UPI001EF3C9D6|nr:riboflavin synthase [Staphylococcus sp. ACRSN]MCG7338395.1 riboflavin synthase [Staphylococcus sp. ACRSN]